MSILVFVKNFQNTIMSMLRHFNIKIVMAVFCLPVALYKQWGTFSYSNGASTKTITLPLVYSQANYAIVLQDISNVASDNAYWKYMQALSKNNQNFTCYNGSGTAGSVVWFSAGV